MTRGKTDHMYRPLLGVRYQFAFVVVFAITLAVVCHLFAHSNTAQGQSPDSVLERVPEVAGEFQTPNFTPPVVEPFQLSPSLDLISNAPQGIAIENVVMEEGAIDFFDPGFAADSCGPSPECLQCVPGAATQSIKIRKNVLGCQGCYQVLPQDEIWVVSARGCSCDPGNVDLIKVLKFENNNWQPSDLNALSISHQNDTGRTTMLYVHGNQTNYEYGITRGFQFYDNLFVSHQCPRAPVRLVLWLWESERELPRLYSDYLVKSRRAVTMGKTLTKTLNALGNRQVALVGFSLGAQVVLSALEQMERGCDCDAAIDQKGKFNVALIAPATDPQYVCNVAGRNVRASVVSRSSIIINSDDRAVKAMRFVIRHECPEARDDFAKLARCNCLPLGQTQFFEVSQEICRKHAIRRYTKSPTVKREMCAVLDRTAAATF